MPPAKGAIAATTSGDGGSSLKSSAQAQRTA
ncbi:hypothetical protein H206_05171 [Candidatus Electrothrix aarhusensis]|uniref:Uncharacterized protein n=1 Tax=Candidatus Electrothrix aarhusensis TaxID=1859131 RepID=A0A444J5C4_9BACT|nr:hypothetical protein H206_05171 [Candidatus Electrothrix aarhusensis]